MFTIQWMNFNGVWRNTDVLYASKRSANEAIKLLGLVGNPAYRVKKIS